MLHEVDVLYLLDADTLIKAGNRYYPLNRFPTFWTWLVFQGTNDRVKVAQEQFDEITSGNDEVSAWLQGEDEKSALLLKEEADQAVVADIIENGYGDNLNDAELAKIGKDPFLMAYCYNDTNRSVVTFEVSAPSKQGANRKVPDVCKSFNINCCDLFALIDSLNFNTNWTP